MGEEERVPGRRKDYGKKRLRRVPKKGRLQARPKDKKRRQGTIEVHTTGEFREYVLRTGRRVSKPADCLRWCRKFLGIEVRQTTTSRRVAKLKKPILNRKIHGKRITQPEQPREGRTIYEGNAASFGQNMSQSKLKKPKMISRRGKR